MEKVFQHISHFRCGIISAIRTSNAFLYDLFRLFDFEVLSIVMAEESSTVMLRSSARVTAELSKGSSIESISRGGSCFSIPKVHTLRIYSEGKIYFGMWICN